MFQFESLSDFAHMAGHGPYVWAAYAVSLAVMAWLVLRPLALARQHKRAIRRQGARHRSDRVAAGGRQTAEKSLFG